jgi:Fic family protein
MKSGKYQYIWALNDWPNWRYDPQKLERLLGQVRHAQGHLFGRMSHLGLELKAQASFKTITLDVIKTCAIEGEELNLEAVRSSVAVRLGIDIGALSPTDRHVDGIVEMILDATGNAQKPLTLKRLKGWHAALFPTGYSGMSAIKVGAIRDDSTGPMQVVSGALHRQKVQFQAPPAKQLDSELKVFLAWLAEDGRHDPVIKAGLAHLWFVTLHPFDDGNGRIARAVGDMVLAQSETNGQRYYSLSSQIQKERKNYYEQLEATQKGTMDVTAWLAWFLGCLLRAIQGADEQLSNVLFKSLFWQHWSGVSMNLRQIKLMNKMLDGFEGKLTTSKWASIAKCSSDTALRDISELLDLGVLQRSESSGRSTSYLLTKLPS